MQDRLYLKPNLETLPDCRPQGDGGPTSTVALPTVQAYVDGACYPNPGRGGWGAVLQCKGREKRLSGSLEGTVTNNAAEITAAIEALRALKVACRVEVLSDSEYLVRTMRGQYRRRTHLELWFALDAAVGPHEVTWTWVRGHAGDRGNEIAHQLAEKAGRA